MIFIRFIKIFKLLFGGYAKNRGDFLKILERSAIFLTGAVIYGTIELLSRGWTHWSMLMAGGICITMMYVIANQSEVHICKKWILCAAVITTVEFICGIIFNLMLNWHIWDYTNRAYNLLGQICPTYSFMWLGLSVPGVWLCKKLHILFH